MIKRVISLVVVLLFLSNTFVIVAEPVGAVNNLDEEILTTSQITMYDGCSTSPSIVTDDSGTIHLVWADDRQVLDNSTATTMSVFYKLSTDDGYSWTADKPIAIRNSSISSLGIAYDDNSLAISWQEEETSYIMYSYDSGFSWSEPFPIYNAILPIIGIQNMNVFIIYKNVVQAEDPYITGMKVNIDPGIGSPQITMIDPTGGAQISSSADIAIDERAVHVVIKDEDYGELHYYKSEDNGTSWRGGVVDTVFGADTPSTVQISSSGNNVDIVWSNNRSGHDEIYMMKSNDYGDTWQPATQISDGAGDIQSLSLETNSESLHLSYQNTNGDSSVIEYMRVDLDGNIEAEHSITNGQSTAVSPSLALSEDNDFFIVWEDDKVGDEEIYFCTSHWEFDDYLSEIRIFIENMPDSAWNNKNNKRAFLNKIDAVESQLREGAYLGALNKINNDIIGKMDGFLGGNPKNDWLIDEAVQIELRNIFSNLITNLELKSQNYESIGGSEWVDVGTSSDAVIQQGPSVYPNSEWSEIKQSGTITYREGSGTPNILINIPNQKWAKNMDYRITFRFLATASVSVMQLGGPTYGDYYRIGTLEGSTVWKTSTIETDFNHNYDFKSNPEINVLLELRGGSGAFIYLDSISLIPIEANCDVGTAGDNDVNQHDPGICLYPNFQWAGAYDPSGRTVKSGTYHEDYGGPNIYINSPDPDFEYRLKITYRTLMTEADFGQPLLMQQWGGDWPYNEIGTLISDKQWHTSIFMINRDWYVNHAGNENMNVIFQIGFEPPIQNTLGSIILVDSLSLIIARNYCDVGTAGDDVATIHEPGISLYPNDWGPASSIDGHTVRKGENYCNFYLNDIDTSKDYVVRITYKSNAGGTGYVRQLNGGKYETIGTYIADGQWHTDWNSKGHTYGMNALFELTKELWVDEISVGVMEKYAILIGGGDTDASKNYDAFKNDLSASYKKLKQYDDWNSDNIYSYLWDENPGYYTIDNYRFYLDGMATKNNMESAFRDIGSKITYDDFFYFTFISHASEVSNPADGAFILCYRPPGGSIVEQAVRFSTHQSGLGDSLKKIVDNHIGDRYARSAFIIQTCFSGHAITGLAEPNRIVMSATEPSVESKTNVGKGHWAFLWGGTDWDLSTIPGFLLSTGSSYSPVNLKKSFLAGYEAASSNSFIGIPATSHPMIYNDGLATYTHL